MFKNFTIKVKILGSVILGLTVLSLLLTTTSINETTSALLEKNYSTLTASRDSKIKQIETFFSERIGDIQVLSKSEDVQNLGEELNSVYKQLNLKNYEEFPVNNISVKNGLKKHEAFFQNYAKEYGYYDIFIIGADHGHVMYTQAKESDFGANLSSGSLKDSSLAEVWRKVKDQKRSVFVDMRPYAPSNGAPAMFLGTPIFYQDTNKFSAVLVFQISDKAINNIMQFRKGYGESQEDYLVGPDKLMRSDSYLDPKGHSLQASFLNGANVDTKASSEALAGKTNTEIVIDYNGNPVLSAYSYVKIGEDLKWAILSEIDEAEVMAVPYAIRNTMIVLSLVLFIVVTTVIYFVIMQGVVKPLNTFQDGLLGFFRYLNREADDAKPIAIDSNDEIGVMSKVVNQNIAKSKDNIEEDRRVIDDTINVLSEFEQGDLCQRVQATTSNPALQELTSLLNKMGENVESNIDNVLDVLEQYSNYNYMSKVDTANLKEHLLKLANGVNDLGEAITGMLVENKSNGLTLDESSTILLKNVDILNKNSNEAAAALEETAAALEEITSNITHNTENVVKMSSYANELTVSANDGQKLAQETTVSMDEINAQVTAISEAISVIDQIAFQTNILSLNAAVEAATAGEAGKGFAVVAGEVRNLAARSAEAASEIKSLVENATVKANNGKTIADKMISGYNSLNENVLKTMDLIKDVEMASKEQQSGIEQINDAVTSLDQQTQQNAMIATQTHDVAVQTDEIAKLVVLNADEKEFEGKDSVESKFTDTKTQTIQSDKKVNQNVLKQDEEDWKNF